MKNNEVPCYHFPTICVLIDDDESFLESLALNLQGDGRACHRFYEPGRALAFLKKEAPKCGDFIRKHVVESREADFLEQDVHVNIPAIHRIIYEKTKRFEEISTLVIDYHMPGVNDLEFYQVLVDLPFKKIMLTGAADDQVAIKAFNEGMINRFILKNEQDCEQKLHTYVQELQEEYFQEQSTFVIESLKAKGISFIQDETFIEFFHQLCRERSIVEHYLMDDLGNFLLLDEGGHCSWLLVKTENEMGSLEEIAREESGHEAILEAIQSRKSLTHFAEALPPPVSEWSLYPCTVLEGETKYYCAITDQLVLDSTHPGAIVSAQEFLLKAESM